MHRPFRTAVAAFAAAFVAVFPMLGGTVITNNLPANTAIINIDAQADGAANYNGDESLWYSPFDSAGAASLPEYTVAAGTYTFRVVDPPDAATLFPHLTSAQTNEIYTAWTYNSPWNDDYLVFDAAAATNNKLAQIFDGCPSPVTNSPAGAYSLAISSGDDDLIRLGPNGRDSTALLSSFTFSAPETLAFVIPDYGLSDNGGGVSVVIAPAAPNTISGHVWTGGVSGDWANPANWTPNGTPGADDTAIIEAGTAIISNAVTCGTVEVTGGTLDCGPELIVGKAFDFTGGTVNGALIISSGATLTASNSTSLNFQVTNLVNLGTAQTLTPTLNLAGGAAVTNSGAWQIGSNETWQVSGSAAAFYNTASASLSGPGGGVNTFYNVQLNNAGTVELNGGGLTLTGGGAFGGTFNVGAGTLTLGGGGFLNGEFATSAGGRTMLTGGTFTDGKSTFTGAGGASLTGGTLDLTNDAPANLRLTGGTVMVGPQFQNNGAIANLTLQGATLAGTNEVSGMLNWTAGTINGVLTVLNTGVVNVNGSGQVTQNGTIINMGQILWNGSGGWALNNGASITNLATGLIDIQFNQTMSGSSATAFSNAGQVQKSQGTRTATIYPPFYNSGLLRVLSGTMAFQGGGTFGGSISAGNGTTLNLDNGGLLTGTFSAGFEAAIDLAGGAFTNTAAASYGGAGVSEMTGGTLSVENGIAPGLALNGGTLNLPTGFQGGAITNLTLTNNETLAGSNVVSGVFTFGGTLSGPLYIASGGVFNWQGGTANGSITIGPGGILNWSSGTAARPLTIEAGGVLNATGLLGNQVQTLQMENGVTNLGQFNWLNGNLGLNGPFYNQPGAVFNVECDDGFYNDNQNQVFFNFGLIKKFGASNQTVFYPSLNNDGSVEADSGTLIFVGGNVTMELGGAFAAESGATIAFNGNATLAGSYAPAAGGTIDLVGGTFNLTGAASFAGSGTNIMTGGSITLAGPTPGLTLAGGTVSFGTAFEGGVITNLNLDASLGGSNYLDGILTLNGDIAGPLTVAPGSVLNWLGGTLRAPLTIPTTASLNILGTVNLDESLTNNGTINWSGGEISMPGGLFFNNAEGAVFNIMCDQTIGFTGATLNNAGEIHKFGTEGGTTVEMSFNNLGPVDVDSGTLEFDDYNFSNGAHDSYGGIFHTETNATIQIDDGGELSGLFTNELGGSLLLTGGSFTNLPGVEYAGAGRSAVTGGSLTLVSNVIPNLSLDGTANITLSPYFQGGSIQNFTFGGNLLGNHTVSGVLDATGGEIGGQLTILSGAVVTLGARGNSTLEVVSNLVVPSGATLNLADPGTVFLQQGLTNQGTVNWTNGYVYVSGAPVENEGAFNITAGSEIYGSPLVFYNDGSVLKTAATGVTTIGGQLINRGSIEAQIGALEISSPYNGKSSYNELGGSFQADAGATLTFYGSGGAVLTGSYHTAPGGLIQFAGGDFTNSASAQFTGGGDALVGGVLYLTTNIVGLELQGGLVIPTGFDLNNEAALTFNGAGLGGTNTINGSLSLTGEAVGALTVNGTLNLSGDIEGLVIVNGTLNLSGALEYGGTLRLNPGATLNWTNGWNEAPLDVPSGATVNLVGGEVEFYAAVTNSGVFNWRNGYIYMDNDVGFYNQPGGVFNAEAFGQSFETYDYYYNPTFYNAGLFKKSVTGGLMVFELDFTNSGALDIESGSVLFNGDFANTGGSWAFGVNSLADYGQARFEQPMALSGPVTINLNNGFQVAAGETFPIVTNYNSLSGTFSSLSVNSSEDSTYQIAYATNGAALKVVQRQAPSVSIASPVSGAVINGSTVDITVNGAGQLTLFANGASIFSGSASNPFHYAWTQVPPGIYVLTAQVSDSAGAIVTSAPVTIFVTTAASGGRNYTWTGGGDGTSWSDGANWNPSGVPGGQDSAAINAAGSVNLAANTSIDNLALLGGELTGAGTLTVASNFIWSAGGLHGGSVAMAATATMVIAGQGPLDVSGSVLATAGTTRWQSGDLVGDGQNQIINSGTWLAEGNNAISNALYFTNSGAFYKTNSSGATVIATAFNTTGQVKVEAGTLELSDGGDLDGPFTTAAGAGLELVEGNFLSDTNAAFSGAGTNEFGLTGNAFLTGVLDISTNLALIGGQVSFGPNFQDHGAITNLNAPGVHVLGPVTVVGKLICGFGELENGVRVAAGGALILSNSEAIIDALTIDPQGTVLWTGGYLYGDDATFITNNGVWLAECDEELNGGSLFVNNGTLLKTNSVNTTFIELPFVNNAGKVDAASGSIAFYGGGNIAGAYNAAADAEIEFEGGAFDLGAFPLITGGGQVELTSGDLTVENEMDPLLLLEGGTVTLGPSFQDHGVITNLTLTGGTLTGTNVVAGSLLWKGGSLDGSLTVLSNATLTIVPGGFMSIEPGVLTNFGTVQDFGNIQLGTNSVIDNAGLWVAHGGSDLYGENNLSAGIFTNESTFVMQSATNSVSSYAEVPFFNGGVVEGQSGQVNFEGGGPLIGTYKADTNAVIAFSYGNFTLDEPMPTLEGPGVTELDGATLLLMKDQLPGLALEVGSIELGPAFQDHGSISNLTFNAGCRLLGTNTVTGTLTWEGNENSASGPLTIANGATFISGGGLIYGSLTNLGTVVLSGDLNCGSGVVINNFGTWMSQGSAEVSGPTTCSFLNNGLFQVAAAPSVSEVIEAFTNNGTVTVLSGPAEFNGGGWLGGTYNAAAGAMVTFGGGDFFAGPPPALNGPGSFVLQDGYYYYGEATLTLGQDEIPGLALNSGALLFGPNFQDHGAITNLTVNGSTLPNPTLVTGTLTMVGNEVSADIIVASTGTLNLAPANYYTEFENASVLNYGTVEWGRGYIQAFEQCVFTNFGTWVANGDNTFYNSTFYNYGAFGKTTTTGTTTVTGGNFINDGALDIQSGTVQFQNAGYGQAGAALNVTASAPSLNGSVAVNAPVSLDGSLTLQFADNFTPNVGDVFTVLTYASHTNNFESLNLPPLAAGMDWQVDVGATAVSLRVVASLANADTLKISGTVKDANGNPIPGMVVYATSAASQSNLVQNGSFELPVLSGSAVLLDSGATNVPGWEIIGPVGRNAALQASSEYGPSEDGNQYLDLSGQTGGAGATQTIATTPGMAYDLVFYHSSYSQYGSSAAFSLAIGTNAYAFGETDGTYGNLDWREEIVPFVATSASTTLTFLDLNPNDYNDDFIDNIQVEAPDTGRALEAVTGSDGSYQIAAANGSYNVGVSGLPQAGFAPVSSQAVVLNGAGKIVNFTAQPAGQGQVTVTAIASPANAGTVAGGGVFSSGVSVTLTATVTNAAYKFQGWYENGVLQSASASYTFAATATRILTALFVPATYQVTTLSSPTGVATLSGGGSITAGSSDTVVATLADTTHGYVFQGWFESGSLVSQNPSYTFTPTNNVTLTALYAIGSFTISAHNVPAGAGLIAGIPNGDGSTNVTYGETIVLTAQPTGAVGFLYWTADGAIVSLQPSLTNTVTGSHVFDAIYGSTSHYVTAATSPAGLASIVGGNRSYFNGQNGLFLAPSNVVATPNQYTFQYFVFDGVKTNDGFSWTFTGTDPANISCVAYYAGRSIDPVVTNVFTNYGNPVPPTRDFVMSFQFDRTMAASVSPVITLTNAAAGAVQPVAPAGGSWTSVVLSNDTFVAGPVAFGDGMDGAVQVFISGAQDPGGKTLALTNPITLQVESTRPDIAITSPTNGAWFDSAPNVPIVAAGSAVYGGGVSGVAFYTNGVLLSETNAAGPSGAFGAIMPTNAGSYALTAVVTDKSGLVQTSAVAHVTVNNPGSTLVDFEAVDASVGPASGNALLGYLSGYGVTLGAETNASQLGILDDNTLENGQLIKASSGDNFLGLIGASGSVSYTLSFASPLAAVSWTRPTLFASQGGLIAPAWRAHALDPNGVEIAAVGEPGSSTFNNVPARTFKLLGPNIASLRFDADNNLGPFATLPLDDLLLSTVSPAATLEVSLQNNSGYTQAPGTITLSAQAGVQVGSVTNIDFYEGGQYLGSTAGNSGSFTVSELAAGTYAFTAVATDDSGDIKSSSPLNVTVASASGVSVINFDAVDASSGAVGGQALSNYLAQFGVSLGNVTLGSRVEILDDANFSGAVAVAPSQPNLLTQDGLNTPVSFTLDLSGAAQSIQFTRAALVAGPNGITHPQWSAHILDANGVELESVSEPLINSRADVSARTFLLAGQGIRSIRFDSDSQQTAAFSAVLLDNIIIDANTVAAPLTVSISSPAAGASFTAPANIDITPNASDSGGVIDHVDFYAGGALIGSSYSSPYTFTWPDVLAGSYALTANVIDSLGYAVMSAPVSLTVNPGSGSSTLVNFDSLNATRSVVSGKTLTTYLTKNGIGLANVTAGTTVSVANQGSLAGGAVVASSAPNVLTQTGATGPASFTVDFSPVLTQFNFTRPQLDASPLVTHPAWQARAYDALGVLVDSAQQPAIVSFTNVPAQTFTLAGPGIASVEFDSQGSPLMTFDAVVLDDFLLTTSSQPIPPAVVITNPQPGELYNDPVTVELAAATSVSSGAVTNVAFYDGGSLIGSVSAAPFTLLWTNPIPGSHLLTAVAAADSGLARTSPPVAISVYPAPGQLGFLSEPVNETAATGGSVVFSVVATNGGAISYEWLKDGRPVGNLSTLLLNNLSMSDAGAYTVVIAGNGQSLTSAPAVLTVLDPPTITNEPPSQIVQLGTNLDLVIGADGDPPLHCQWLLNGTLIPGQTNLTLSLSNAQPSDSGNYQAQLNNPVGATSSDVASISVRAGNGQTQSADAFSNRISINPLVVPVFGDNTGATTESGEPLPGGKVGGASIWYTWHATFTGVISLTTRGSSFDTLLAVYTGSSLAHLTPVAADDDSGGFFTSLVTFNVTAGTDYQIDVDGFHGATGSVVLGLAPGLGYRVLNGSGGDTLPVLTRQPTNQIIKPGATAKLVAAATSATPASYQWYIGAAPVAGATSNILTISNFQAGSVGVYHLLVVNAVGSASSENAEIDIGLDSQAAAGAPAYGSQDKFGDAVDLSGGVSANSPHFSPGIAAGGDSRGYSLSQVFSTVGATTEPGEPNPSGQPGGASEWYIYTTPATLPSGSTFHADTAGSQFNTILAVYTGTGESFASLKPLQSGFTTNYLTAGQPSLNIPTTASSKYFVQVQGLDGASGTAVLNLSAGLAPQIESAPLATPAGPDGRASFSVSAFGATNLFYQWQFNSVTLGGATNATLVVSNAQNISIGNYTVVVSNAIGAVTSAPASLTIQEPPFISTAPADTLVKVGQTTDLTVVAGGLAPLAYQWFKNGAPIAGATKSTLAFSPARYTDSGSFTVLVSNAQGAASNTVPAILTVIEAGAPSVVISTPQPPVSAGAPTITLHGTAADSLGVANVEINVNNNGFSSVSGTTRWTTNIVLNPGTNIVVARSFNLSGGASTLKTNKYFYAVPLPLTLISSGHGSISGAPRGGLANYGENYTITAVPAKGAIFQAWMAGVDTNDLAFLAASPKLRFMMSSNLILQANFITNPFPALAGNYNGLFYPSTNLNGQTYLAPDVGQSNSGFITLSIPSKSAGAFSGKMLLNGAGYPLAGSFNGLGDAALTVRAAGQPLLHLDLQIGLEDSDVIVGSVSNTAWTAPLLADRAVFSAANPTTNFAGNFTVVLPPGASAPTLEPDGYGYLTISNTAKGNSRVTGVLADGAVVSQSVPVSSDGFIPVYESLYAGKGSLEGWLNISNLPPQSLNGTLNWIRPRGPAKSLFPAGFESQATVVGSPLPPPQNGLLNTTNAELTIQESDWAGALTYNVSVTNNTVTLLDSPLNATNRVSVSFAPATAIVTVTFQPTGARKTLTAKGVVLPQQQVSAGWFVNGTNTGYFLLQ